MKSWRGPRVVFGLVLATLSLIYFVTLVWGPKDQEDPAAKNYLKDLGDQPKAESSEDPGDAEDSNEEVTAPAQAPIGSRHVSKSGSGAQLASLNTSGLRPDELHDISFVVRDAETRQPLPNVTIHLAKAAGSGRQIAELRTDATGNGRVRKLPHAQYRFWAESPGYRPTEARAAELPLDGTCFELLMEPAAQVVGVFEGLDGETRQLGLLHLSRAGSPEVIWIRPDAQGRFASPALEGGAWKLAWMPHSRAQPAPGMKTELDLPTGERTLLEVVLPEGAADPRHRRTPGIRPAVAALQ